MTNLSDIINILPAMKSGFSVINEIALLIAELLPIPDAPIIVKLSEPPIIPLYSCCTTDD